jgi:hypothetical protein
VHAGCAPKKERKKKKKKCHGVPAGMRVCVGAKRLTIIELSFWLVFVGFESVFR